MRTLPQVANTSKDYILQIRVKNGPMIRAMDAAGFQTAISLARAANVTPSELGRYLALKLSPMTHDGLWRTTIMRLSEALRVTPEGLFPPQHLDRPLKRNTAEVEVGLDEIEAVLGDRLLLDETPEDHHIADDVRNALARCISSLSSREQRVIKCRYFEDKTLDEVAQEFDCSKENVRAIENKALAKLKHPSRASQVLDAGYEPFLRYEARRRHVKRISERVAEETSPQLPPQIVSKEERSTAAEEAKRATARDFVRILNEMITRADREGRTLSPYEAARFDEIMAHTQALLAAKPIDPNAAAA